MAYQTLEKAGWILEENKSDARGQASQTKECLGFVINTATMTVQLKENRGADITQGIQKILQSEKSTHVKDLAKILGKIAATEPALGTMPLMASRAAHIQLDKCVEEKGWNCYLKLDDESKAGLIFFADNWSKFDNTVIRTSRNEISVLSIIGPPKQFVTNTFVSNHLRKNNEEIWASNASGFATCAYSIKAKNNLYYRGKLSKEEQLLSSGHRELLAVSQTLQNYSKAWKDKSEPINLYWLTDSENLVVFLSKGSGKAHIQRDIFKIMEICQTLQIHIIPIHLRREDPRIQLADEGSKTVDTDDWQVNWSTFNKYDSELQFSIDLFASSKNAQCKRFYSNFWCKGTSGIDAFCHNWDEETAWICPPIKLILKVIRKINVSKIKGVLFVPEWQTADFWPEIFNTGKKLRQPFTHYSTCRPFLMQENFDHRSPFSGETKFNFLALYFNNKYAK